MAQYGLFTFRVNNSGVAASEAALEAAVAAAREVASEAALEAAAAAAREAPAEAASPWDRAMRIHSHHLANSTDIWETRQLFFF
jgi:hypothetical protein